jgi:hypothetical protein
VALNYPPFVVLSSHFRITGGHDLNPTGAALEAEDQQLFNTFDAIATQVMATAGVSADLRPIVVALASMAPGISATQRTQLASIFVKNAMAALNNAAPALAEVMPQAAAPLQARMAAKPRKKRAAVRRGGRRG